MLDVEYKSQTLLFNELAFRWFVFAISFNRFSLPDSKRRVLSLKQLEYITEHSFYSHAEEAEK